MWDIMNKDKSVLVNKNIDIQKRKKKMKNAREMKASNL